MRLARTIKIDERLQKEVNITESKQSYGVYHPTVKSVVRDTVLQHDIMVDTAIPKSKSKVKCMTTLCQ